MVKVRQAILLALSFSIQPISHCTVVVELEKFTPLQRQIWCVHDVSLILLILDGFLVYVGIGARPKTSVLVSSLTVVLRKLQSDPISHLQPALCLSLRQNTMVKMFPYTQSMFLHTHKLFTKMV